MTLLAAYYLATQSMKNAQYPPLSSEYNAIQIEFYRYYIREGAHPENLDFLTSESKQVIETHRDQFEWDKENKELHWTYVEAIIDRSPLNILTLGLIG